MSECSTWQVFFEHTVRQGADNPAGDSPAADIGQIMGRLEGLALPRSTLARMRHTLVNAVAKAERWCDPEGGDRSLLVRVLVCDPEPAARLPGMGWAYFIVNRYAVGTPALSSLEFYLHRGCSARPN
jgi:hypothetical protein